MPLTKVVRFLSNDDTTSQVVSSPESRDREAYEFVAFLLWYLFLVVCCVLPTCCAYRRRRLMEARIAQQQANFDHLHQQNILILSNLRFRPDMNGEEARAERTKRITEALQLTTFVSHELNPWRHIIFSPVWRLVQTQKKYLSTNSFLYDQRMYRP